MKKYYIIIAIIFLWGLALRSVEVLNHNYLFGFDVGRDLLVARSIVVEHKFTLIGAEIGSGSAGINGIFQGPGYYYLLAIDYAMFQGNPYGVLFTMYAFGVASLLLVFITVRRMFDRWTAAMALFLAGISPLIVSQSRFIWAPHPATPFIVLSLYFTYLISRRPRLYGPLAMATAAMTYHFEIAMTVPMVLALFAAFMFIYRIKDVRLYAYSLGALLVVVSPFFFFEMRHGWMATRSILSYSGAGGGIPLLRILDHGQSYIYNAMNSFTSENSFLPPVAFEALCAILVLALIVFAWRVKDGLLRRYFQFLFLLLIASYVVLLFLNNTIWDYYLIHVHFIFMYVFAYFFVLACSWFRKSFWAKLGLAVLAVYLVSMIASSVWRMKIDYTYDYHDLGGVEKIQGKKIAIDYVYHDAKGKPFSEFTFMAPIYTYPYDYLFQTYGKEKYGYAPTAVKKGTVYLIIEPDRSKPWTYKGWEETVIAGGDIIKTVTLPTGHIIQERQFP